MRYEAFNVPSLRWENESFFIVPFVMCSRTEWKPHVRWLWWKVIGKISSNNLVFSPFWNVTRQLLTVSCRTFFFSVCLYVKDTVAVCASVNPAHIWENAHTNTTLHHVMMYCKQHIAGHTRIRLLILLQLLRVLDRLLDEIWNHSSKRHLTF